MLRALLLAPPGAGKGTQGERLAEIYKVPHLSTGDLLREAVADSSELGVKVASFMERGDLVPDELIIPLMLGQISSSEPLTGFVLDGFPRTPAQAQLAYEWGLASGLTLNAVISLVVPAEELVERLVKRGEEVSRSDDTVETIRLRQTVYAESTAPLLEYYKGREILIEVDGTGTVDEVTDRIVTRLDRLDIS
jgi:adenylate kinase